MKKSINDDINDGSAPGLEETGEAKQGLYIWRVQFGRIQQCSVGEVDYKQADRPSSCTNRYHESPWPVRQKPGRDLTSLFLHPSFFILISISLAPSQTSRRTALPLTLKATNNVSIPFPSSSSSRRGTRRKPILRLLLISLHPNK